MLDPAMLAPERIRPFDRREFEQLIELGVFEGEHVELLRGVLVEMSPQGEPHGRISAWFAHHLCKLLDIGRFSVRAHTTYLIANDSMPEPDVLVCAASARRPDARDALLLIEVSGSSLMKDRVIKNEIYAAAGVPEYWIVNLKTQTVEVRTRPSKRGYGRTVVKHVDETLRPMKLRGVRFAVSEIPWTRPWDDDEPAPSKKRRRVKRS